ncbi:MAG: NUDIX hydrolase [Methylophagaceae bacterium]
MSTPTHHMFKVLYTCLPACSEEGDLTFEIQLEEIDAKLIENTDVDQYMVSGFTATIGAIFNSLGILDSQLYSDGIWRFVSFPASLFARSLIITLSEEDGGFFQKGYWEQGHHRPSKDIEKQRELLAYLESYRVQNSQNSEIIPIRNVHVAWGVIKIGDDYLLHHREDGARKITNTRGNYVFPGGRTNHLDGPEHLEQTLGERLPEQFYQNALEREIFEELALQLKEDYTFQTWRELTPYCQVEGARNNHAYTEYFINMYSVNLTNRGEIKVFERLSSETDNLTLFSREELYKQKRSDGKTAFIQALKDDLKEDFNTVMDQVATSIIDTRKNLEIDSINLPVIKGEKISQGKTGKEKEVPVIISEMERVILLMLGFHAKQLPVNCSEQIKTLPLGWLLIDDSELLGTIAALNEKLNGKNTPLLDIRDDNAVRINIVPERIYFSDKLFSYEAIEKGNKWQLKVTRDSLEMAFFSVDKNHITIDVPRNVFRVIRCIEAGSDPLVEVGIMSGDIPKSLRVQVDKHLKNYGLRKLVRDSNHVFHINVKQYTSV